MYYPLEAESNSRIISAVIKSQPKVAEEEKPGLSVKEVRDIVLWNTNMIKSAINDILADKVIHHTLNDDEAFLIRNCPFGAVVKNALDFKFNVGDRQMTEEEVYKYASEIIDARINRIRKFSSGAFYE